MHNRRAQKKKVTFNMTFGKLIHYTFIYRNNKRHERLQANDTGNNTFNTASKKTHMVYIMEALTTTDFRSSNLRSEQEKKKTESYLLSFGKSTKGVQGEEHAK